MRSKLGNPAQGADFFPRPDVVNSLVDDLLSDRGSRRMFSLRRIGKTSVLLEVERRLREQDLLVIRVDVQGVGRFNDFVGKVFEQIPTTGKVDDFRQRLASNAAIQTIFTSVFNRFAGTPSDRASAAGFQSEFSQKAAWAGDINNALTKAGPIILLIDELPYMLRNMIKEGYKTWDIEQFLAMLRDWRLNCGVRMLMSGSLGLGQLSREDGVEVADHVGDVMPVALPPLTRAASIELVEALAAGEKAKDWSRDLSEAIVDASAELWPIFLQYGFDAVRKSSVRDPEKVKDILAISVKSQLDDTFYAQFDTRLQRYKESRAAARTILKAVLQADPAPASFDDITEALGETEEDPDDLLEALKEDDLITVDYDTQTVMPASRLVPLWARSRAWGR